MNWDQIEQKWGEMTMRVQPRTRPLSKRKVAPEENETQLLPIVDTPSVSGVIDSANVDKISG